MANFTSYLADLTDATFSTREVDLNGFEVGNGIFETDPDSIDLGNSAMDGVWISEAGKDDDVLSAHRHGRVQASFALRIAPGAASIDVITTACRRLNQALNRAGVWVLQQPNAAQPVFIDYYPSDLVQQLMPGQRSMFHLWTQLQQPNGMGITILRRPFMRAAALGADLNYAHNGTFAEDHNADGVPSFWSWDSLTGLAFPTDGFDWSFGGAHEVLFTTVSTRFLSQDSDSGLVTAGATYSLAFDVAGSYAAFPSVKARIDWLDNLNAVISTSRSAALSAFTPPVSGFARLALEGATAPGGAVKARFGIECTPGDSGPLDMLFADLMFEAGGTAHEFRARFETVANDSTAAFGKHLWIRSNSNADALTQIRATPDESIAQMTYARRSGERDSAMAMRTLPGWHAVDSTALVNGTTNVSGETGTVSGHAAKTDLQTDVMQAVIRHEVYQNEESALRGVWLAKVALRGDLLDIYDFELHYGVGNIADLALRAADATNRSEHNLDLTGPPASSQYYELPLGLVRIPAGSPGVFMELWAMRESDNGDTEVTQNGTGELYIDQIWLEPADDEGYAVVSTPTAVQPGTVTETYRGDKLTTPPGGGLVNDPGTGNPFQAGSVYNTRMLLNDLEEATSIPAAVTAALTPGVEHTFICNTIMFTQHEKQSKKHGEVRIHNLTDNVQVAAARLVNDVGVAWFAKTVTLRFTPVAGKAYLVYVVQTVQDTVGNIHVLDFVHTFQPVIQADIETIAVDADQRRTYTLQSDAFHNNLILAGPFLVARPLLQLVRFDFASPSSNGSDDVYDGGPALLHDPAMTVETGVHMIPRWSN